jgi:TonB family protein
MPRLYKLTRMGLLAIIAGVLALQPSLAGAQQANEMKRKVRDRITPNYPELARKINVRGKVKIEVIVGPDGRVKGARAVGGHPLLVNSAQDAAMQWKFESGPGETTQVIEFDFR